METLRSSIIEFAINNRKALEPAEEWLNSGFDGEAHEAWDMAINQLPRYWWKIVFIAWLAFDKKIDTRGINISGFDWQKWKAEQDGFEGFIIFKDQCNYSFSKHPNYWIIKNALDDGKAELSKEQPQGGKISQSSNNIDRIPLDDLNIRIVEELAGRDETLTIRKIASILQENEFTVRDRMKKKLIPQGLAVKCDDGFFATDLAMKWYRKRWPGQED